MDDRKYTTFIKLEILGTDIIIENADISIDYTKTDEKKPNYCDITIYNMSDETYKKINDRANAVRVYVDIDGNGWALVFAGNLRNLVKYKQSVNTAKKRKPKTVKKAKIHYNEPPVRREQDGNDIATIISLEDGVKNTYFNNFINMSFKESIENRDVLNAVLRYVKAHDTNIKISANTTDLIPYTYKNGVALHGSLKSVLNSICKTGECSCTVQDDVIVIAPYLPDNNNHAYVYVLNGDNCPTPEANTDKELSIQAPFLPALNPFNWVQLQFRDYEGFFRVKKIKSRIDNFGNDSETEIIVQNTI